MSPGEHRPEHKAVVLLVDDQRMIGEAVRRMLSGEPGIEFHFCQDPNLAVQKAIELKPTVILQDLVMPGVDGLTLVKAFRAEPATQSVPLIVLSTKEEPNVKVEAFARGANDYIVKLPDRLELVARIRYHSQGYISVLERDEAYRQLELRERFIRETFGRYLSDEVVASLLEKPEGLELGGEMRQVTILMADLRGFTGVSERLPPHEVVRVINNYLEVMTDVIFAHDGTIDEFMGDAILVIFGAPIRRKDDARRAVACAVAMQLAMPLVNAKNRDEGLPEVEMGIGLATGPVVAGNIGSFKRAKYGIVGANVNLAFRIESCSVGGQVLASEKTLHDAGSDVRVDSEMQIQPKGLAQPITIYEIGAIGPPFDLELSPRALALSALSEPIPVRLTRLENKQVAGAAVRGRLVRASLSEAEISSDLPHEPLTDLAIELEPPASATTPFYGKVLGRRPSAGASFALRFTSLSPEVAAYLTARLTPPTPDR